MFQTSFSSSLPKTFFVISAPLRFLVTFCYYLNLIVFNILPLILPFYGFGWNGMFVSGEGTTSRVSESDSVAAYFFNQSFIHLSYRRSSLGEYDLIKECAIYDKGLWQIADICS